MGYVDADMLTESQTRYQGDLVDPVRPDVSWKAKDAERFDNSRFSIDLEPRRVCCPDGEVSQNWGLSYDHPGKAVVQVRFPSATCRAVQCIHNVPGVQPEC